MEKNLAADASDSKATAASLDLLRQLPYFARLDDMVLATVARMAIPRTYERGQVILLEGEPCAGLCIVQSGRIKVFKISLEGREQVLRILGPGKSFNDVAVFDGGPNPASVMALESSTIWVVDRMFMLALVHRYPALSMAVVGRLAAMARHLVSMVEALSFYDVTGRLARLLLLGNQEGAAEAPAGGLPRMTQTEMAAHLGTVREMVGRSLHTLEDEGLIEVAQHRILIRDAEGLRTRAMLDT